MEDLNGCRLLLDPPQNGAWNMALDEVLLEWAAAQRQCAWRFYRWQEPTLSLGYFQPYEDRHKHSASRDCPAVRRLTGGGAIVHDAELTYSLVLPRGHRQAAHRDLLYQTVHATLVEALARLGVTATVFAASVLTSERQQPVLCFQRRVTGDVLVAEAKIAGSAQRRRRGAVLQHGSVLLLRSAAAPELPGLQELTNRTITSQTLAETWLAELAGRLAVSWSSEPWSRSELQQAGRLVTDRYAADGWTRSRLKVAKTL